jgi:hypothetical protein
MEDIRRIIAAHRPVAIRAGKGGVEACALLNRESGPGKRTGSRYCQDQRRGGVAGCGCREFYVDLDYAFYKFRRGVGIKNISGNPAQTPDMARYLRLGMTRADLERQTSAESDTAAARRMQAAKQDLFAGFRQKRSA